MMPMFLDVNVDYSSVSVNIIYGVVVNGLGVAFVFTDAVAIDLTAACQLCHQQLLTVFLFIKKLIFLAQM